MVVFNNALAGAAGQATGGADAGYTIERSLRFNRTDEAFLSKTPSTAGNRNTFTFSTWIKRANLGVQQALFNAGTSTASGSGGFFGVRFLSNDKLNVTTYNTNLLTTTRVFRDPSAWYHIVITGNTTETSNQFKIYVNGVLDAQGGSLSPSADLAVSNNVVHEIGRTTWNNADAMDGCLAETYFVDGKALAPTDFGELDDSGVWQPKQFSISSVNDGTTWSSGGDNTNAQTNQEWTKAFNGVVGSTSHGAVSLANTTMTWSGTIPANGKRVRVNYASGSSMTGGQITVNSTNVNPSAGYPTGAWVDLGVFSSDITSLSCSRGSVTSSGSLSFTAIEVDGEIVLDNYNNSTGYGTNGFYLDFSDNSSDAALGDDSSGNSNDWTVNNLSSATTLGVAKTSISYAIAPSDYPGTSTNDQSSLSFGNTWTVGTGLTTSSYIIIDTGGASHTVDITPYGSDASNSYSDDLINWTTGASTTANSNYNEGRYYWIQSSPSGYGGGLTLTSASTPDGDSVLDSPTNYNDGTNIGGNYCTLNPLDKSSSVTLSNGNLEFGSGGTPNLGVRSTIWITSGKYYWEVTNTNGAANYSAGIANKDWPLTYVGVSDSFGMGSNGVAYPSVSGGNNLSANNAGDVLGIAFDADNGLLEMYVNGATQNFAQGWTIGDGPWSPAVGTVANDTCIINFGQRQFAYTPPTGYKALCTQNLDNPTIENGSDYFDTKIYTGNSGELTIGGVAYSNLLTTPDGFLSTEPVTNAFDGSTSTRAKANTSNDIVTFDLSSLNLTGSFEFWVTNASSDYSLDGGSTWTASTSSNWTTATTDISGVANIKLRPSQGTTLKVTAFRNQGNILTDGTGDPYNFSPDLVWIKSQSASGVPHLYDTVRSAGVDKSLQTSTANAEGSALDNATNGYLSAFTSNGFSLNAGTSPLYMNVASTTYAAWAWDAGDDANPTSISVASLNSSAYDQSQTWSSMLTAETSGSVSNPTYAFDGTPGNTSSSSARTSPTSTQGGVVFTPTNGYTVNSQIRVYGGSSTDECFLDFGSGYGSAFTLSSGNWNTVYTGSGTLVKLMVKDPGGNNASGLGGIEIDGKLLIDNGVTPPASVPSIASTVRANPTAGFSICSYSGSGSNASFGHGLNTAPKWILIKRRNGANNWDAFHQSINGMNEGYLHFNSSNPFTSGYTAIWNSTDPTSSVVSIGTDPEVNNGSGTYIAYCWAPVEGYSAFGSYTGNGDTSGDGPFVYTGFRPALVMIKTVSTGEVGWAVVHDSEREPSNVSDSRMFWNDSYQENTATGLGGTTSYEMDILSNGFKLRNAHNESNILDKEYVYACWAENPFKVARAR